MRKLKNCKIFDLYGRRMQEDENPHFVIIVADVEDDTICEYGILNKNKFELSKDVVYDIESFAEMPETDSTIKEKGCMFCAAMPKSTNSTIPTWPMFVKYKADCTNVGDEEVSIVCISEERVQVLKTKLSETNDAGSKVGDSFYRVGVM